MSSRDASPLRLEADGWLLTDDRRAGRYEARPSADGGPGDVAVILYRLGRDEIELWHTEVPPALAGHGIGSRLVRAALDDARARGLRVVPTCPFVSAFLRRHPEYHDVIAPEHRGRFAGPARRPGTE
jgi:predicted GNAT family acetyltransferase